MTATEKDIEIFLDSDLELVLIIPASQALRVMQVLEAARQSGASGKSVDVQSINTIEKFFSW